MKILLLEDDYNYRESIKEYLETLGFEVDAFDNGADALDAIYDKTYYLLILDVKVPEVSGHEIIRYVKDSDMKVPIMIITSLVDIDNVAIGYELGCNEYLKKPFELVELKYRVLELINKFYPTKDKKNCVCIDDEYYFDIVEGKLYKDEKEITLSAKERELIMYLVRNKNAYASIEMLREEVWEGKAIHHADIRMHVRKVRQKTTPTFIESFRGLGYKINVKSDA
jgi:DNA-binding response OmpR family regulator